MEKISWKRYYPEKQILVRLYFEEQNMEAFIEKIWKHYILDSIC